MWPGASALVEEWECPHELAWEWLSLVRYRSQEKGFVGCGLVLARMMLRTGEVLGSVVHTEFGPSGEEGRVMLYKKATRGASGKGACLASV